MNLSQLKKYSFEEAIYLVAFNVSEREASEQPLQELIQDYEHLSENVAEVLDSITEREEKVLRYVLEDRLTLEMTGAIFGVTHSRARGILNKAFTKLRRPVRQRILSGEAREERLQAEREKARENMVAEKWENTREKIADTISHPTLKRAHCHDENLGDDTLNERGLLKLKELGIKTLMGILERFPYDSQTNCLQGLTTVEGISETDYKEIWLALYYRGFLIREPELPDIGQQRIMEAEMRGTSCADVSIYELELSVRSHNCLSRAGIDTVHDLLAKLEYKLSDFLDGGSADIREATRKLQRVRNLGHRSAEEIFYQLQWYAEQQLVV